MKENVLLKHIDKSFFRVVDRFELFVLYAFCFAMNIVFEFGMHFRSNSDILISFINEFTRYRIEINILFTFIIIVFHYQLRNRKKTEIYCRILVGDTLLHIRVRYILECLIILIITYLLTILGRFYYGFNLFSDFYLVVIFTIYMLISANKVK